MDCDEYREALSARLDDEEGPEDARHPADLHLEYCGECALWYDNAALITRRTRTTAAVSWPDVADAVLARVPAGSAPGSTRLRLALGAVGAVQGASALFTLAAHGVADPAAGYGTAAWDLALGVAFSAVAARRAQPGALVPLLGAFVGVLSWGYVSGLVAGESSVGGVLSYGLTVLGFVLVVLLGRRSPVRRAPVPPAGSAARYRRPGADRWTDGMPTAIRRIQPTKAA